MRTDLIETYFIKNPKLRIIITKIIFGTGRETINLAGTEFVVDKQLENGYLRAFLKNRRISFYRDEVSAIVSLSSLITADTTFVDVGANVGIYSSVLSRFTNLYPNLKIMSYEVDPQTYSRLSVNSKLHEFEAINKGISAVAKQQRFVRGAVSHVTTTADKFNRYSIEGAEFVSNCVRLDSEPVEGNNVIIKIDVEGQELDVLKGAEGLFKTGRVSAVYMDGYGDKVNVIKFLREFEFTFVDVNSLKGVEMPSDKLLAIRKTTSK